jgi:hypothetical protein
MASSQADGRRRLTETLDVEVPFHELDTRLIPIDKLKMCKTITKNNMDAKQI